MGTENILKHHDRNFHKEEKQQDLSCEYCKKVFKFKHNRKQVMNNHMRIQHNSNSNNCRLCYIEFKYNYKFKKHISRVHTSKEEKDALDVKLESGSLAYECKLCKKRFLTENILSHHNRNFHKEEKRKDLSCRYCNKIFKFKHNRKQVMKNHMKSQHNLNSYEVDEQQQQQQQQDGSVESFMRILNSLNG